MASLTGLVLMMASSLVATGASYNTSLSMCGTPSNPKTSEGYACTGALFTAVDINKIVATAGPSKSESNCVAAMLGFSTQLKGYHCLAFKNCPGADCTCEVRQGCGSSQAVTGGTKACLYGVKETSQCPADAPAPAPTSSGVSQRGSVIMIIVLVLLNCLFGTSANSNASLSMCGTPSRPKTSEGYECTGALFTAVDINKIVATAGPSKSESNCVAAMLGFSTQLKGYHCLAFKNCPGAGCTCEVRQGCSSSKSAASGTKACLYGVKEMSQCPADAPALAAPAASSTVSQESSLAMVVCTLVIAGYLSKQ